MASVSFKQGITTGFYWPLVDPETGVAPASIDGLTAKMQVRAEESPTGALLFEPLTQVRTVGDVVAVTVEWTAAQSLLWGWQDGFSDVILYSDGEPIQVLWQGSVMVDPVVTNV